MLGVSSTHSAGYVSDANTAGLDLLAHEEYVGEFEDASQFASLTVFVAVDGGQRAILEVDFSTEFSVHTMRTLYRDVHVPPSHFNVFTVLGRCMRVRIRAHGGPVTGCVQTILHKYKNNQWPATTAGAPTNVNTPAEVVKSVMLSENRNGTYSQVPTAPGGGGALVNMDQEPNNFRSASFYDFSSLHGLSHSAGVSAPGYLSVPSGGSASGRRKVCADPSFQCLARFACNLPGPQVTAGLGGPAAGHFFARRGGVVGVVTRAQGSPAIYQWTPCDGGEATLALDGTSVSGTPGDFARHPPEGWDVQYDGVTVTLERRICLTGGSCVASQGNVVSVQVGTAPSERFVPQSDWVYDKCDGRGVLPMIDFSKPHSLQIVALGTHAMFYVQSTHDGAYVKVHGLTQVDPGLMCDFVAEAPDVSEPLQVAHAAVNLEGASPLRGLYGRTTVSAHHCDYTISKHHFTCLLAVQNPVTNKLPITLRHLHATFIGQSTLRLMLCRRPLFREAQWRSHGPVRVLDGARWCTLGHVKETWFMPPQTDKINREVCVQLQPGEWVAAVVRPCLERNLVGSEVCTTWVLS